MFSVLYRWSVSAQNEAPFRRTWKELSQILANGYGMVYARLHRNPQKEFVAYTVWETQEAFMNAGEAFSKHPHLQEQLVECTDAIHEPEYLLAVEDIVRQENTLN